MGIKKVLTDVNTDVPMEYHVIDFVNVQYVNGMTFATLSSYFTKDSYLGSKRPLHQDQVQLLGVPPQGADVLDWVQAQLVLPQDTSSQTVALVNRWRFAGGEVIDHLPQAPVATTAPVESLTPPTGAVVAEPEADMGIAETPAEKVPATAEDEIAVEPTGTAG